MPAPIRIQVLLPNSVTGSDGSEESLAWRRRPMLTSKPIDRFGAGADADSADVAVERWGDADPDAQALTRANSAKSAQRSGARYE